MANSKILILTILVNLVLISCQDPVVHEQNAVKMTKEELKTTIGYEWFYNYWTIYKPDTNITKQIAPVFDSNTHKFIIFVEASCSCRELVKEPADLVKSLDLANISSDYYEIYAMGSIKSKHPFEDKITISTLPQIWLLKSGEFVYSILDTFSYYKPRKFKYIEEIALEALQRN